MPLYIPEDHYQVSYVHRQTGSRQLAVCTMGMHDLSADFAVAAPLSEAAWMEDVCPQIGSSWTLERIDWRTQQGIIRQRFTAIVGGIASAQVVGAVAYLINKRTSAAGRKFRGRLFLPGAAESAVNEDGSVVAGVQADLNTAFANYLAQTVAAGMQPVLLHNVAAIPPVGEGGPTNITSFTTSPIVGIQRRRLRGG